MKELIIFLLWMAGAAAIAAFLPLILAIPAVILGSIACAYLATTEKDIF